MIKRILSGMGLVAVLATGANAQISFTFTSGTYGFSDFHGAFTPPQAALGFVPQPFNIWCVEELGTIPTPSGAGYASVFISNLNGGNLDIHTKAGQATSEATARGRYAKAASLANAMMGGPLGEVNNRQYAIWAVIHNKSAADVCRHSNGDYAGGISGPGLCGPSDVAQVSGWAATATNVADPEHWYVITERIGLTNALGAGQEFLAQCDVSKTVCGGRTTTDEDPTPEPATMGLLAMGLAGMAGASLRRRNKK